jgi:hypothetical protein
VTRSALLRAAATMVAVLGALGTSLLLGHVVAVPAQVDVLVVVSSLLLGRTVERGTRLGPEAAVELVAVSLAAAGAAWLLLHEQVLGEAALVVGLSVGILARRYDGVLRRAGRVVSLPFLALLVTPVPVASTGGATDLFVWSPVGVLIAFAWTAALSRIGQVPARPESRRRPSRRRIDVPTRMAVQMVVGLTLALIAGRLLFEERWAWCVLSAFIVASGNRGRGDVAHKAGLRVSGAAAGTVLATVATFGVPTGPRWTLVALFVVMAVALVLRTRSYAFWAMGMTAMLALLHAYYGSPSGSGPTGTEQLVERLGGVALGSVIGLASAWWVLPVRTREVFRSRAAACLRALTDDDGTFPDALAALDQLTPTVRAGARHHAGARRQLAAIQALHDLPVPEGRAERGALRREVGRIRRSMVGKDHPSPEDLRPDLRPVLAALQVAVPPT